MTVRQYLFHQGLAAVRSPMFLMDVLEKALMALTMLMAIAILFVAGYFLETFDKSAFPGVTSFTVLTLVLNIFLLLDLALRPLAATKLDAPVRPYLFLMVSKTNLARLIMFDYFFGQANAMMFVLLFGLGWLVFFKWPFPMQSVSLVIYFLMMLVMNTNLKIIISRLLLVNWLFRFLVIFIVMVVIFYLKYDNEIDMFDTIIKFPELIENNFLRFGILVLLLNGIIFYFVKSQITKVLYIA